MTTTTTDRWLPEMLGDVPADRIVGARFAWYGETLEVVDRFADGTIVAEPVGRPGPRHVIPVSVERLNAPLAERLVLPGDHPARPLGHAEWARRGYPTPATSTRAATPPSTLLDVLSGAIEAARAERKATAPHLDA
ncbi:MAG: hypothetical protein OEV62_00045 [Actinomycetota bacterium]|nr:hypothetical protein [Actinomycetota bacterium]